MSKSLRILASILTLALVGTGLWGTSPTEHPGRVTGPAGLKVSRAVIEGEIAHELAERDERRDEPQHPDGYENYRKIMRPHPEGTNVKRLLMEAKKQVERMPVLPGDKDAGLWNWQWLGPGNIGGRVRAILTHPDEPNTLWIGSAGGGIWKTTDGGNSWTPLDDFLPSLAVTALAMDPTDPDIIYASTGEGFDNVDSLPGAGVFKSLDGGLTWAQLPQTDSVYARYMNDIAHHPVNSGWLIAVGSSDQEVGKIWRTEDGGATWSMKTSTTGWPMDVKYDPDDPDVVIIGTSNGALRSDDAGENWVRISDGATGHLPAATGRCEIAFDEGNDVVYASCDVDRGPHAPQGEIWRSLDNGITWEQRSALNHLSAQGWYDNVIWVVPGSATSIIVGGVDLYASADGGQTLSLMNDWTQYHHGTSAHADQHAIVPDARYGVDGNFRIYIGNDGGIQVATNGILTQPNSGWVNLANGLGITQFYHADITPDGRKILGGSQDNDDLLYTEANGAQSWFQATTGDGTFCAIDPVDQDTMYACYPWLGMQRTYDGGATYYDITSGLDDVGDDDRALFVAPFALDKVSRNRLVAGGREIWLSNDRGSSWHSVHGAIGGDPLCSAVEIAPAGSRVIWVGYSNGYILKSENFGMDWIWVEEFGGPLPNEPVTDIEISPHDPDVVMVTFGGYYTNRVWLTTDGGDNWICRSGSGEHTLPAVQVNCITYHPGNQDWIYAGTDIGLFASEDGGQTWNVTPRYGANDGPVFTEISDLIWHSDSNLVAVTHGRGMFQCLPLEEIWVNQAYTGTGDGTPAHPFDTINEGYLRSGNGSRLVIFAGDYNESHLVMEKRLEVETRNGTVIIR